MEIMKRIILLLMLVFSVAFSQNENSKSDIKLVLQIVVDQMRGDIINKYKENLSKKGFNYLIDNGMNFTNTHFIHSITKTAPGHASIATGSIPAYHGIVGNDWYDRNLHEFQYACQDDSAHLLGEKTSLGLSPKQMIGSAIADEINLSQNGKAKIFAISIKDRGAIFLGGHSGKAFWYSKSSGNFVSSDYYFEDLPEYVKSWNSKNLVEDYYKKGWNLLIDKNKYKFKDLDSNSFEKTIPELGYTFPHSFDNISLEQFKKIIAFTPWGDRLTSEFAKMVISAEKLGQTETTDYLSISFSCTDYIGHLFGPQTLEYEDQIVNLDFTLSQLFEFIDEKIGLDKVLIVVTADHGVCEAPEFLETQNIPTGVLAVFPFIEKCNNFAREKFNFDFDVVFALIPPYIYLDEEKISKTNVNLSEVETQLAALLAKEEGVYRIFTATELKNDNLKKDFVSWKVQNSYNETRSGNLYIVPLPNWFLAYKIEERNQVAATHGTPWDYDTFVPLIIAGPKIPHGFNSTPVGPHDIAPTIADYLKIKMTTGNVGNSLLPKLVK